MDKCKNLSFKKGFVFSLALILFAGAFCFLFAPKKANLNNTSQAYINQIEQLAEDVQLTTPLENFYQSGKVTTVYNFVVPIRFSGESDIIESINSTYNKTNLQVLYDMYNAEDKFSVKKYYKVVSNGRLNLETVFILDDGKSLEISKTRTELGNKNNNNGIGYNPSESYLGIKMEKYLEYHLLQEVCDLAIDTISQSYSSTCDSNNDNQIDSLTISLMPEQNSTTVVGWSDLLWPHSTTVPFSYIKASGSRYGLDYNNFCFSNNGSTITFGKYMMSDYDDTINESAGMPKNNTDIHELGHVLGFPDYYVYDTSISNTVNDNNTASVLVWDIMAYNHLNLPQYPLSYNRLKQNWIDEANVVSIQGDGTYSLLPVNYEEVNNISLSQRPIAYKIVSEDYPNQAIYFEYRNQVSGSFENNPGYMTDGLLVYRVDEGFAPALGYGNKLTIGNFAATPYNIYVFRNEWSNMSVNSENQVAALNTTNKSMGDNKTYNISGNTVTTDVLTWQVYSGNKRQDQYTVSEVTEVDSGISVEVISINQSTGLLTFKISGFKPVIEKSSFADEALYYKLLNLVGKSSSDNLYASDLENLTSLDLYNLSLSSLQGLLQFDLSNLVSIDLSLNKLSDYSQITQIVQTYPNLKLNLAFNNFNLNSLPNSLKTSNVIIGFQNVNELKNVVLFYGKNDTNLYSVDFYLNDNTDVSFNAQNSSNNKYSLSLGKNTLSMTLKSSVFTNTVSIDVYLVKVYLQDESAFIERNSNLSPLIFEGLDKNLFNVVQSPQVLDTSNVTSNYFSVNFTVTFKQNTTQTKNLTYSFKIVDTTAPIISLGNDEIMEVKRNSILTFPNPEIIITDNGESVQYNYLQNPASNSVNYWTKTIYKTVNGQKQPADEIDMSDYATYLIEYTACDQSGNLSQIATRRVEITANPISRTQIPDQNLYKAICDLTQKLQVYENSLLDVSTVDLSYKNIQSIQGLNLLGFKDNAVINLMGNNLSSIDEVNNLTNACTNIKYINLHLNNFVQYDNYNQFFNISKVSLGIQGIQFGVFVQNGNVGQTIEFYYYGQDQYFYNKSTALINNGLNIIEQYGKYDFVIEFKDEISNIQDSIEFGAIEFANDSQTVEVYQGFAIDINYYYFNETSFDTIYYLDNSVVSLDQINLNQSLGTKQVKVLYSYQGTQIKTITKIFNVVDTTSPTIEFENKNSIIYLKYGQTPQINVLTQDNYDAVNNLNITLETDFVANKCGSYKFNYYVTDLSGNKSSTITKTVKVGNVTAKQGVKMEYLQSVNFDQMFNFEVFKLQDFYITSSNVLDNTKLSTQTVMYQLSHKYSTLIFDLSVKVKVVDSTVPVITLNGKEQMEIYVNGTFTDPGFIATDNYDGSISSRVIRKGYFDANTVGTYRLEYTVTDSNGNKSVPVYRTISVKYKPMPTFKVGTQLNNENYTVDDLVVFTISLDGLDSKIYNFNSEFNWYVDGELVYSGTEKTFSYKFDEVGQHKVTVSVTNSLLNGQTSITNSEDFFVLISEQSFLSKYGLFAIGGVSVLIVTFVILSFVIRRKRKFYL